MHTTRNHNAIWWTLGAIAVLAFLWLALRNTDAGIPNTGIDNTADSGYINGIDDNALENAGSPAVVDESKG